jgi:hypothetical protein
MFIVKHWRGVCPRRAKHERFLFIKRVRDVVSHPVDPNQELEDELRSSESSKND